MSSLPINIILIDQVEGLQPDTEAATAAASGASAGPGAALLEALLKVPDLATPEDREQLAGITALGAVLQELAATANGEPVGPPRQSPLPDFLQPLLPAQVLFSHAYQHNAYIPLKMSRMQVSESHDETELRAVAYWLQANEVAALLQWLGAELPQLPDAERLEAIRLAGSPSQMFWALILYSWRCTVRIRMTLSTMYISCFLDALSMLS